MKEIKLIFQYYLSPLMLERSIFCLKFVIRDCLGGQSIDAISFSSNPNKSLEPLLKKKKKHCYYQVALDILVGGFNPVEKY